MSETDEEISRMRMIAGSLGKDGAAAAQPQSTSAFDGLGELSLDPGAQPSMAGVFGRSALNETAPLLGGFAAAGTGAELGGAGGAALGTAIAGPAGTAIGGTLGAVGGGAAAMIGGSAVTSYMQDKLFENFPRVADWLGQSPEQKNRDIQAHPYAEMAGQVAPLALTMSPFMAAEKLPETATAMQRIMNNPYVARAFSGTAMAGMDIGQQLVSGNGDLDWTSVAVSGLTGAVFAKPNAFGEKINNLGSNPVRAMAYALGMKPFDAQILASNEKLAEIKKTQDYQKLVDGYNEIAKGFNEGVIGPAYAKLGLTPEGTAWDRTKGVIGGTDEEFNGRVNLSEEESETRIKAAGQIGNWWQEKVTDIHDMARQINPAHFAENDFLTKQKDQLAGKIDELRNNEIENIYDSVQGHEERGIGYQEMGENFSPALMRKLNDLRAGNFENFPEINNVKHQLDNVNDNLSKNMEESRGIYEAAERAITTEIGPREVQGVGSMGTGGGHIINQDMLDAQRNLENRLANPDHPLMDRIISMYDTNKYDPTALKEIGEDFSKRVLAARPELDKNVADASGQIQAMHVMTMAKTVGMEPRAFYEKYGPRVLSAVDKGEIKRKGIPTDLFQKSNLHQGYEDKMGTYTPSINLIKLFEKADPTTIFHEMGHQFLHEMIELSKLPEASSELKQMAQTTMDWMKLKDVDHWDSLSEKRLRSLHEKFADAWVQYLHNGIAPSRELGNVFAMLKKWFANLYHVIKNEKIDLSGDIRGVFDRLLSEKVEHTIVAPDRVRLPDMSDIHSYHAAITPIHKADKVADQIQNDVESAAARSPEISNEINKGTNLEAERRKAENAKLAEIDRQRNAETGSRETGEGTAEKHPSGTGSEREGDRTSANGGKGNERGTGGNNGSESTANSGNKPERGSNAAAGGNDGDWGNGSSNPNAEWRRDKSGRVMAGKLNLALFNMPEDVMKWVQEQIAQRPDLLDPRKGSEAYANAIQAKYLNDLFCRVNSEAFNAAESMKNSRSVEELTKNTALYLEWKKRSNWITRQQDILRSGWGYLGHALQQMKDVPNFITAADLEKLVLNQTGKTLGEMQELATLAVELKTPADFHGYMDQATKPFWAKVKDSAIFLWLNWILSGPITHMAYQAGNTTTALFKPLFTTPTQALLSALTQREVGERIYFGEAMAQLHGMFMGNVKAIPAAISAIKSGVPYRLAGETGTILGPDDIPPLFNTELQNPLKEWMNPKLANAMAAPMHSIQGIHTFNKIIGYNMELSRLAWRQAADESVRAAQDGLAPVDIKQRWQEVMKSPSVEMLKRAAKEGNKLALNERAIHGSLTQRISQMTSTNIWAKLAIPFAQVEMNLVKQGLLEHTPVGLAFGDIRSEITGQKAYDAAVDLLAHDQYRKELEENLANGKPFIRAQDRMEEIKKNLPADIKEQAEAAKKIQSDLARGKMLAGSMLGAAVMGMVGAGVMTGGCSDKERPLWALTGKQPYSILINGHWEPMRKWMGYLAKPFMLAADTYQIAHHITDQELQDSVTEISRSFGEIAVDGTWMGSMRELFDAVGHEAEGERYIKNFAASLLPYSSFLNQVARLQESDPYQRKINTFTDAVVNKIPGLSQQLLPKYDIFGQPMVNRTMITPIEQVDNKLVNEMTRLEYVPNMPGKAIRSVELTPEQYAEYCKVSGRVAAMQLMRIVNGNSWNVMKDYQRKEIIKGVFSDARRATQNLIINQSRGTVNDISAQARQNLQEEIGE